MNVCVYSGMCGCYISFACEPHAMVLLSRYYPQRSQLANALMRAGNAQARYAAVERALLAGDDPNQRVYNVVVAGKYFVYVPPLFFATTPALAQLLVRYGAQVHALACVAEQNYWSFVHLIAMSDVHEPELILWCAEHGIGLTVLSGVEHTPAQLLAGRLCTLRPEAVHSCFGFFTASDRATARVVDKLELLKKQGAIDEKTMQALREWEKQKSGWYCGSRVPGSVGSSYEQDCSCLCACCAGCALCVSGVTSLTSLCMDVDKTSSMAVFAK